MTRGTIAAVICCTVGAARADPLQDARLHAEQADRAATDARAPALFVACGNAFLELYRLAPTARDGADEAEFNAGVCFEQGRSPDAATAAFRTVIARFPRSRLAAKAMVRAARVAAQVGKLDEAASWLETYATKYAGEADARMASSDASYLRQALGEDAKVIEDVRQFSRNFSLRDQDTAAALTLSLTPIYERRGPDDAIKRLRDYLKTYGTRGGLDRRVDAYAELGILLWRKACPVKPIDGLCVAPPARNQVGRPSAAVKRDAKLVTEASSALASANRAFEDIPSPQAPTRHLHAMAQLASADLEREAHDDARAEREYEAVVATADPEAVVAASARLAGLARSPARALELYTTCVAKASELAIHDDWSQLCQRERATLDPTHFAADDELRPDPVTVWPDPSSGPVSVADHDPDALRAAVAEFEARDRAGWNATTCRRSADRFAALARTSVMAPYMVGLSYQRCDLVDEARAAYQRAGDPRSLSNLGALEWHAGHGAAAEQTWRELLAHGDVDSAHLGLAIALFDRAHGDRAIEREAEAQLGLARMSELASAFVVAAIRDLGRPALADYDLHQAENEQVDSLALDLALGVRAIQRGAWPFALDRLGAAVALRGAPDEARLDLALALLAVDRFGDAIAQLSPITHPSYDVLVALGIALRGQGKLADADAAYARAIALAPTRGLALYDRGILDKDYVARTTDGATRRAALRRALDSLHHAAAADPKLGAGVLAAECEAALAASP